MGGAHNLARFEREWRWVRPGPNGTSGCDWSGRTLRKLRSLNQSVDNTTELATMGRLWCPEEDPDLPVILLQPLDSTAL